MNFFTLESSIILGLILFAIGAYGVISRRNLLVVMMSLEIMFNAVNLILIAFTYFNFYQKGDQLGHYMVLLIITVAAAEAAVGLAILVTIFRNRKKIDADDLNEMKG